MLQNTPIRLKISDWTVTRKIKKMTLDEFLIQWLYLRRPYWRVFSTNELRDLISILKSDIQEENENHNKGNSRQISKECTVRFLVVLNYYKQLNNENLSDDEIILIDEILSENKNNLSAIRQSEIEDLKKSLDSLKYFNIKTPKI